jgi:FkbM family methyltransferase
MNHLVERVLLGPDWLRDAGRLSRNCLPPPLKRRALRTQASLYRRLVFGAAQRPVQARILDFEVAAFSLKNLALLFREMFVDLDYFFEAPNRAPFILDCGSNIGMSVLFFKALYPVATIIGFEPATATFDLLQRNVCRNELRDVVVHQCALGHDESMVDFFESPEPGSLTASTNVLRSADNRRTVRQARLSSFIDRSVDFLKLDVEGAEWGVIDDLIETGRLSQIAQMSIEYHHHIEPSDDRLSEFLRRLECNGFGYQMRAYLASRGCRGDFQNVLIYAYRK